MEKQPRGYFQATVKDVPPGSLYKYRLNEQVERPDPASRFQPEDVHGASQVVADEFEWHDVGWGGRDIKDYIIYEIHVGAFTRAGTFEAIIPLLDELKELGITAIELMPVAQFPGTRNWGYDGAYPYAVQASYGGPDGLKKLVDACHQKGLAVILDVVYNHLGPEGNYTGDFGYYFTERYHTAWGRAFNFDGAYSDEVRCFFIENALYWITQFHLDALRLDAVHAILDSSVYPFIQELTEEVHRAADCLNRRVMVIAESNRNEARLVTPAELGGYNLDGLWNDDFHHALHVLLTGEGGGYYQDFGELNQIVKAFRQGFVYTGEYAPFWLRRRGTSPGTVAPKKFVVFAQNHDQIGNRPTGERLSRLVSFEALKLAAGAVLLSPFTPLLFMGEEYGETAPFPYFISHIDPDLVQSVRDGRAREFVFKEGISPPDPQSAITFESARLNRGLAKGGDNKTLRDFYRELIRLRKTVPALALADRDHLEVTGDDRTGVITMRRCNGDNQAHVIFNFSGGAVRHCPCFNKGEWLKIIDSASRRWAGPGSNVPERVGWLNETWFDIPPWSVVVFLSPPG